MEVTVSAQEIGLTLNKKCEFFWDMSMVEANRLSVLPEQRLCLYSKEEKAKIKLMKNEKNEVCKEDLLLEHTESTK